MRMVWWKGMAAAMLMLGAGAAHAQEARPDRELALAREIIELGKSIETMNALMATMTPAMVDQYRAQGMSEALAERLVQIFLEEFAAEQDAIIELTAVAYADRFTEQQLVDIRDFLASPSGREYSAAGPELTAAMSRAGMIIGEEVGLRAAARLRQERERGSDPS
jgi:hypothetical protein